MNDIQGIIVENKRVIPGYYLLTMKLSTPMGKIIPGQFVMLQIPGKEIFLRRPFSIYDYDRDAIAILYKIAGKGTDVLSKANKGEHVQVLGPLGNGFKRNRGMEAVLIAGGIGIAGIHLLAKAFKRNRLLFFGCSNKKEIALLDSLEKGKNTLIATLDGTYGFKGTVVDLLKSHLKTARSRKIKMYACGPEAMFRALKETLEPEKISCEILVEERMACGLGLCFGCVKKTTDEKEPYKRVCIEGPVFDIWKISL